MARYKIYAAEKEDVNQGWVWIGGCGHLHNRSVLKLTAKDTGKIVYCEMLSIDGDNNFLNDYNDPDKGRIPISDPKSALVASWWYRDKLGVKKGDEVEIDVKTAKFCWCRFLFNLLACSDHPQVVLRFPAWLGIWSVILGAVGVILGIGGLIVGIIALCQK
jgi:hypothetical protein